MAGYPAGVKQQGSISVLDAGGEKASTSVFFTIITAANIVAQGAAWATLLSAHVDLFLGEIYHDAYIADRTVAAERPTNGAAREISLKLIARDDITGQSVNYYFPTLNLGLITYDPNWGAKDVVDMTTDEVAAFIDALEGVGLKNPYAYANSMAIVGAQVVRGQR